MPRDRDREVKCQKKSRETRLSQVTGVDSLKVVEYIQLSILTTMASNTHLLTDWTPFLIITRSPKLISKAFINLLVDTLKIVACMPRPTTFSLDTILNKLLSIILIVMVWGEHKLGCADMVGSYKHVNLETGKTK